MFQMFKGIPSFFTQIDVKGLSKILMGQQHKQLKRQLIKNGYEFQMSLYGVVKDTRTGKMRYVRIEILSPTQYNLTTLPHVYEFFHKVKPIDEYTIWIFNPSTKLIKEVGHYGTKNRL